MAILNQSNINIGLPNESANSDSLYVAFNKIQNNFTTLFSCASPYNTFIGGNGITTSANSISGTISIDNSGVISILAGTNITTATYPNGAVEISSAGGGGGLGTVTSVDVVGASGNARITTTGGPIIASGTIVLDLADSGVVSGTYTYPTLTVDQFGRITNISNANSVGTVTSVNVIAGPGMQVTGGPITDSGDINVINTGVIRLNAGAGIGLSDNAGNVTISLSSEIGTVTSVEVVSSTLTVSGGPIVTAGSILVDLPGNFSLPTSENLQSGNAVNLSVVASYFTTTGPSTATLAAGANGQVKTFMMDTHGGDMVITVANAAWIGSGTMSFQLDGIACTLQYVNNKWYCIGNNGVVFG